MAGRLVRLDKNPGMMEDPPITQWLFNSTYAAWGWLAVRLYVGYQWVVAGEHKVTDPAWMSTGEALKGFWVRAAAIPAACPRIMYCGSMRRLEYAMWLAEKHTGTSRLATSARRGSITRNGI